MVAHVILVWRGTRSDLPTGQAELDLAIRSVDVELLTDLFVLCAVRSVHGGAFSPETNGDATILACTVDRLEEMGCLVLSNDGTGKGGPHKRNSGCQGCAMRPAHGIIRLPEARCGAVSHRGMVQGNGQVQPLVA